MMTIYTHNVANTGRITKDNRDEDRLVTSLKQNGVFHNKSQTLQNIMNKDAMSLLPSRNHCLLQSVLTRN